MVNRNFAPQDPQGPCLSPEDKVPRGPAHPALLGRPRPPPRRAPHPTRAPAASAAPLRPALLTMGFLNSLGLMQRTKKGWQAPSVRISSSSDRLNWLLSVGDRFLVSAPCGGWTTAMGGAGPRPCSPREGTGTEGTRERRSMGQG